jgi:hypothetical protein
MQGLIDDFLSGDVPGDLLPDAPGDDRTDNALKARTEAYDQALDLDWMLQAVEPAEAATPEQEPERGSKTELLSRFMETAALGVLGAKASFSGDLARGAVRLAPKVAKDVGLGAIEAPRQIVGGIRDAVQSIVDFSDWSAQILPGYSTVKEFEDALESRIGELKLPEVSEAKSATGSGLRAISPFVSRYG